MKIQSMFQKDIDRDINGVVQVSQDDQRSLKQELDEYIITKELRRHLPHSLITTSKPSIIRQEKLASGFLVSLEAVNLTF